MSALEAGGLPEQRRRRPPFLEVLFNLWTLADLQEHVEAEARSRFSWLLVLDAYLPSHQTNKGLHDSKPEPVATMPFLHLNVVLKRRLPLLFWYPHTNVNHLEIKLNRIGIPL